MQQDLLTFVPMPRPTLEQPWLLNMSTLNTNAVFLHGSRGLQAIATRRMNLQGWTSKHPGLGKQAKSNWSCQSTCRSGESSGALTLSIKSLCVNVWQWWNHGPSNAPNKAQLEPWPALDLTPDSATTGIKKEINNKSECGALALSFSERRRLRFFFFVVRFIYVNNIFT